MDRESLILKYKKYAEEIADFYIYKKKISYDLQDDIVSISYIGLIKAIDTYDSSRNASLKTYIKDKIFYQIATELRDKYDFLGRTTRKNLKTLNTIESEFLNTHSRCPTESELLLEYKKRINLKTDRSFCDVVYLKNFRTCNFESLQLQIEYLENKYIDCELFCKTSLLMNELTSNERYVIEKYYLDEIKSPQIAIELNITQPGVSYLMKHALSKLKNLLEKRYHVESI